MVISVTPEPPAHMAIFDNYQRIYGNPYVLYKYGYLKEAPRLLLAVSWVTLGAKGWKHPEFHWLKMTQGRTLGKANCKGVFSMSFTMLLVVAKGGDQKHIDLIQSFSQLFSENH